MKLTIFPPPFPGWTSLLCPSPCGAGGKGITVQDSFFLLLLPSHVFPLLWHKLPSWQLSCFGTGSLRGTVPSGHIHLAWSTSSLSFSDLDVVFLLFLTPFVLFYFVLWHFLPFLKYSFTEVLSVLLRGSAVSGCGTAGTSWAWGRATPGLFPPELLLQPLCCQHLASYNQYSRIFKNCSNWHRNHHAALKVTKMQSLDRL